MDCTDGLQHKNYNYDTCIVVISCHIYHFRCFQFSVTPLLKAAQFGHVEVARFLLENGSNVNEQDEVRSVVLPLIYNHVFAVILCQFWY